MLYRGSQGNGGPPMSGSLRLRIGPRAFVTAGVVSFFVMTTLFVITSPPSAADDRGACSSFSGSHAYSGGYWLPTGSNHSFGIEAPITFRIGAAICNQTLSGGEPDQSSSWISIEPGDASKIVQMGFVQIIDIGAPGNVENCSFWANGGGAVHAYACGTSGGTTKYFRITLDPQYADYNLEDCGTSGGYGSCASKNATQAEFSDAWSPIEAEVSFRCQSQMMGSSSNNVDYGSSTYPLKGQYALGGSFVLRPFSLGPADACGYYRRSRVGSGDGVNTNSIHTYDSRN